MLVGVDEDIIGLVNLCFTRPWENGCTRLQMDPLGTKKKKNAPGNFSCVISLPFLLFAGYF